MTPRPPSFRSFCVSRDSTLPPFLLSLAHFGPSPRPASPPSVLRTLRRVPCPVFRACTDPPVPPSLFPAFRPLHIAPRHASIPPLRASRYALHATCFTLRASRYPLPVSARSVALPGLQASEFPPRPRFPSVPGRPPAVPHDLQLAAQRQDVSRKVGGAAAEPEAGPGDGGRRAAGATPSRGKHICMHPSHYMPISMPWVILDEYKSPSSRYFTGGT